MVRILCVEDNLELAHQLTDLLKAERYTVDLATDGQEGWELVEFIHYDLILLDITLPKLDGLQLCQKIRDRGKSVPIMLLTARGTSGEKVVGLDAGADDYLVKPFGMQELLARLRALQRRPSQLQPPQLQIQSLVLDYGTFTIAKPGQPTVALTAKEFQLLEYFMQHPQQILTHDQIKQRLWNWEDESVSNVVAAQVRLLRRKLAEIGLADWIETIRGIGYRLNPLVEL